MNEATRQQIRRARSKVFKLSRRYDRESNPSRRRMLLAQIIAAERQVELLQDRLAD